MWNRISLRSKTYTILAALVFITLLGGLVMVWYTYRIEGIMNSIINRDLAAFQRAEALEIALVNQKGFVSYYFLDGNPDWLRQLGEFRQLFKERLKEARTQIENQQQEQALSQIDLEYSRYTAIKDQVIAYYKAGEKEAGAKLHKEARKNFFKILELCEKYKAIYSERIKQAREKSRVQGIRLRIIAVTAVLIVFSLGVFLAFVLGYQILDPLRKLARLATQGEENQMSKDEVKALSQSVHGLIKIADQTHIELEKSRENLWQAEKMVLVGQLAAGTAHSIRNPLTSVKMRLFSLSRSLEMSNPQKEDFQVISAEIRHIDTIVQNFLEFSRPPRLKMQKMSPSLVVDLTIQLLEHRLKSYDVTVKVNREQPLPDIQADPEQLKEVLVNIMVNACESMGNGGSIVIKEESIIHQSIRNVVISLSDNGPGIPEAIKDKILEPFFTTKDEGSGLGLSIAARIVEEHGGWLDAMSKEGEGTTFIITLPVKE